MTNQTFKKIFSPLWYKYIYNNLKLCIQRSCKYVERRILTRRGCRDFSYALSHGSTHVLLFVIVAVITGLWWHHQTNSSSELLHNIGIGFKKADNDTITTLGYDFIIDSDTIRKKTKEKYHSAIRIHYQGTLDTAQSLIQIYAKPFLYDAEVELDSVVSILDTTVVDTIEKFRDGSVRTENRPIHRDTVIVAGKETTHVGDSIINIRLTPAKNNQLPCGGFAMGKQFITVYSNQLGLSERSYTYNYYIGLGLVPPVINTEHASGYSNIRFLIGDLDHSQLFSTYFNTNRNLSYSFIYPEPDVLSIGYLYYSPIDKVAAANKNKGIIIQCEDLDAKNRNNRKAIIYSVLVGTGVAFLLDILVQLIRELRNVNRRKDEEERQKQNSVN